MLLWLLFKHRDLNLYLLPLPLKPTMVTIKVCVLMCLHTHIHTHTDNRRSRWKHQHSEAEKHMTGCRWWVTGSRSEKAGTFVGSRGTKRQVCWCFGIPEKLRHYEIGGFWFSQGPWDWSAQGFWVPVMTVGKDSRRKMQTAFIINPTALKERLFIKRHHKESSNENQIGKNLKYL